MKLREKYLNHLMDLVCDDFHNRNNYICLFNKLFDTRFDSVIELDDNRIADAIELRAEFEMANSRTRIRMEEPISVLEVMVALAVRCEDSIMGDDIYGDRTSVWFWYMVKSLGLIEQTDISFDEYYCDEVLHSFVERDYATDGEGSLFHIPGCREDLRKVEIWYQMNWWLNTLL